MFIGGRLHRQFREVESDGSGNPKMVYYRNPIPPGLLSPFRRLSVEAIECEEYRMRNIVADTDVRKRAIVYVLAGIQNYHLDEVYLTEPGIVDQLKEIAI
jgi:hypothetical protein